MEEKAKAVENETEMNEKITLELEDLIPTSSTFKLKSMPGEEFFLRAINLKDRSWMKKFFGDAKAIEKAFEGLNGDTICKLAYHQFDQENRAKFMAIDRDEIDDDGVKVCVHLMGWEAFQEKVEGTNELIMLYTELLKVMGVSQPFLDKMEAEAVKKNETD